MRYARNKKKVLNLFLEITIQLYNMKNLLLRSLTGIVYVAFIVASLLLSETLFFALCTLFAVLGTIEFYFLSNGKSNTKYLTLTLDAFGALFMVWGFFSTISLKFDIGIFGFSVLPYIIYLISRVVLQLYTKEANPLNNLAYSLMGQLYIAMPVALMSVIYYWIGTPQLLLAMFIMIWCNDTGAYIIGSKFGQHGRYRLFPRISPKKSWEGFFGGVAFSVASAIIMTKLFPETYTLTTVSMIGLAIVVSVFATWGDLAESLIKRTLGVKDSGNFMPGHGGILDRIDSLLLVVPAMLCYLMILRI